MLHEVTHTNQIKEHGWYADVPADRKAQEYNAREAMGYQAALTNADAIGLSAGQKQWYADQVGMYKVSSAMRTARRWRRASTGE